MNGWLIAACFLILFVIWTASYDIKWSRMQRRIAEQRPSLELQPYAVELSSSGVSEKLANALYEWLKPHCVDGILPNPDDSLYGFYFDDPDDMEDLVEAMFNKMGLPTPTVYEPEITPHMESVRELAIYLQGKVNAEIAS